MSAPAEAKPFPACRQPAFPYARECRLPEAHTAAAPPAGTYISKLRQNCPEYSVSYGVSIAIPCIKCNPNLYAAPPRTPPGPRPVRPVRFRYRGGPQQRGCAALPWGLQPPGGRSPAAAAARPLVPAPRIPKRPRRHGCGRGVFLAGTNLSLTPPGTP